MTATMTTKRFVEDAYAPLDKEWNACDLSVAGRIPLGFHRNLTGAPGVENAAARSANGTTATAITHVVSSKEGNAYCHYR